MSENQSPRHVVSITTGCHSTYLLLRRVEEEMPIDAVLFADTGMEFPEAYEHLWRLDQWLYQERGIHITCLKHPHSFEYMLLEAPIHSQYQRTKRRRLGIPLVGNGWPRSRKRWCCTEMIDHVIDQEICRMEQESSVIHYIPLTSNETYLITARQHHSEIRYPFMEWNDACDSARLVCWVNGFSLYNNTTYSSHCTCWCCPFRMPTQQAFFRESHPVLWKRLLEMEKRVSAQLGNRWIGRFRDDFTLAELEKRFAEIEKLEPEKSDEDVLEDTLDEFDSL